MIPDRAVPKKVVSKATVEKVKAKEESKTSRTEIQIDRRNSIEALTEIVEHVTQQEVKTTETDFTGHTITTKQKVTEVTEESTLEARRLSSESINSVESDASAGSRVSPKLITNFVFHAVPFQPKSKIVGKSRNGMERRIGTIPGVNGELTRKCMLK